MDTNAQIIKDLQNKNGFHHPVDFLSEWKGLPVMITGYIQEVREASIVFRLEPPDSICFSQNDKVLILHDIFILGIQCRIKTFDPQDSLAELGEFIHVDRGFGNRSFVRVEPKEPIPGMLFLDEAALSCQVVDISINGFGLLAEPTIDLEVAKGQSIRLKLSLSDQEIEIPGTLLNIFMKGDFLRLAMSFSQDFPNHTIITRYVTQRRAEIRQEIQAAYQQAVVDPS